MRAVGQQELQAWRRRLPKGWQRAVSRPYSKPRPAAERVGENTAILEVEAERRLPPDQAHRMVMDGLTRGAFRSREDFQAAVRQLRKWNPTLISHLTDEQAGRMLEEQWNRQVQEQIQRVYRQRGRGRELQIRIP